MDRTEIIQALVDQGITDPRVQANILAQIEAESVGTPRTERGYGGTSNERIRKIFGNRVAGLTDEELTALKADEKAFFNHVYNKLGGYDYRGRGLIQLTGKENYQKYGNILGVDLVNNPELANDPVIAKKIAALYYAERGKGKDLTDPNVVTQLTAPANVESKLDERRQIADKIYGEIANVPQEAPEQIIERSMIERGNTPIEAPEQSVYDKGLGAIKQFRNYLGFKKGGDVKEEITTNVIDVSADRLPYDRLQEMARRSMMLGNEQDRMEDYDYAKSLAERPFVNRYPVDSRGQGAYSTAAPMGMQAQRMMGFAGGGMVNDAQGLASLGRGGDSMLVHMQPQEVAGLQRLAEQSGTSLTKNPYTGMPEAFSLGGVLKTALPMAVGAMVPGGQAAMFGAMTPMLAGAAAGGALAAVTGDDPLMGLISGGFGGYSGAGLAKGLGVGAYGSGAGEFTSGLSAGGGYDPATQAMTKATEAVGGQVGGGVQNMSSPYPNFSSNTLENLSATPKAIPGTSVFNRPEGVGFMDQFNMNIGKPVMTPKVGADGLIKEVQTGFKPASNLEGYMKLGSPVASLGLGGIEESDLIPDFEPDKSDEAYNPNARLDLSKDTGISEALRRDTGLRLLARGGYLDGGIAGDGMSDSVKTTIDGRQEARLSEGEFVIPADVVSHLGNGSSDAGAKRLYDMMDKVRKARTGTKQQGKEISPGKYMPR